MTTTATTQHVTAVDEQSTLGAGTAYRSRCACSWADRWHHTDEYPESPDEASVAALAITAVATAGAAHVITAQQDAAWRAHAAARYR